MSRTEEVQTKYWAYEILSGGNKDETAALSSALSTSTIDLNPHQIEAALFALNTSSDLGVILADEVVQLLLDNNFDIPQIGSIVQVKGTKGVTNAGFPVLFVQHLNLLNTCKNPTLLNLKLKELIILKNKVETILRNALQKEGAIEVSTNILGKARGTSKIEPFKTQDLYGSVYFLKFTHEMELKKIIVDTQLPIFEIGKVFRNMGESRTHHHEYTVLEAQFPYKTLSTTLTFVEKTMKEIATCLGCNSFSEIPRYTMREIFKKLGYNFDSLTPDNQKKVYKTKVKRSLGPFFLTNPPAEWSPLTLENNDGTAKDAEFIYNGIGLAHICEEKTDAQEIERSLRKTAKQPEDVDVDFIQKMYLGLPPSTGLAIGVDRSYMAFKNLVSVKNSMINTR